MTILRSRTRLRSPLPPVACAVAMAAIFAVDTLTDYAIAAAVFYTAVILAATPLLSGRAVIVLAAGCVALTLLSFFMTRGGSYEVGVINTGISIFAIAVTAYLGSRMMAAEAAAREAQDRLSRIARVTSVGALTAAIAHEINQPLAAITASGGAGIRWLGQSPPNLERARRTLERIVDDAERASAVVGRLRSLARGEAPRREPFDLGAAVGEIIALSRDEIERAGIRLDLSIDEALPPVLADRVQIQQVVRNLVLNAVEAMAGTAAARTLAVAVACRPPQGVTLCVADTGPGLSAVAPEHLFAAFWTTKAEGLGLGLAISRTLVEANGGQIAAEAGSGGGALFRVTLPVAGGAS